MKYISYNYKEGGAKLDFSFQIDIPLQMKIDFLSCLLQATEEIKKEIELATSNAGVQSSRVEKETKTGK